MSATRCYCGATLLADGTCRYRCPPEARPSLLREQERARRLRTKKADSRGTGMFLTPKDVQQARDVVPAPQAKAWRRYWNRNPKAGSGR
jgi:hypothetical protein